MDIVTTASSAVADRPSDVPGAGRRESERTQGETTALVLACLTVACAGIYFMKGLLGPAFFALTLVITVRPLVVWMVRHRVPRPLAAFGAVMLIYTFVVAMFMALGVAIAQLIETLPQYADRFQQIWEQAEALLSRLGVDQSSLMTQVQDAVSTDKIVSVAQTLLSQLSNVGSILAVLALTVVFLMFDMAKIEVRTEALTRLKPGIAAAMADFSQSVRSYWLVSTIFGLIVAVLDVVALGLMGVPMAVTWGVLSFITNYIPNIGFVVGLIPPALLALVASGPMTALWVVVVYCVLNLVIQSLIQPKFTGDAVGLNMTTTFLSLIFWTAVIGGLGAILAVPLTLFAKATLVDCDPRARWVGIFLSAGDSPVPEDEAAEQETEEELEALQEADLDGEEPEKAERTRAKHARTPGA